MNIKKLDINKDGRDFVVGDVHGHLEQLNVLLDHVKFDKTKDRLISVGDLIDRGPDSVGCIRLLNEPWFHSAIGNHELMMFETLLLNRNQKLWIGNGGDWIFKHNDKIEELSSYVNKFYDIIVVGEGTPERYNVLHAEFYGTDEDMVSEEYWKENGVYKRTALVWGRTTVRGYEQSEVKEGLSRTFVGHSVVGKIQKFQSHVFLDTGSCFYGTMTLVEPKTGIYYRTYPSDVNWTSYYVKSSNF